MAKTAAPCTAPRRALTIAKTRVKEAGLAGKGQVRVNKAGCLDRCAGRPRGGGLPEGTWYTFVDRRTSTKSSSRT